MDTSGRNEFSLKGGCALVDRVKGSFIREGLRVEPLSPGQKDPVEDVWYPMRCFRNVLPEEGPK